MGVVEDLEKLKQLKDIGAISDTEFEVEKSKILNGSINNNSNTSSTEKGRTQAIVGFILGLVSIIAWFIPLIGFPVTVIGIIFSGLGMKSITSKGKAIARTNFINNIFNSNLYQ